MTITFLAPDGVELSAQRFRQALAAQHGGGSGRRLGVRSGFRVDTPSNVLTATSTTWTLVPCAAEIDPGASTHQGGYGWANDSNVTGSVTPADATYARKDIVYIQINDSTAGDGSGEVTANVKYAAGTPSGTPVAPAVGEPGRERSFLVGTISVPAAGGGSPTVALNTARYAAAGAPLPVYSQAERDDLVAYDGLTVQRRDLAIRPLQTYDGTSWRSAVEFGPVTTTDSNWAYTGQLDRRVGPDGKSSVSLGERMSRSGSGFAISTTYITFIPGFIPSGWRPAATVNGVTVITDGADAAAATLWWQITTSGDLRGRLDSGSTTFANNWRIHLSGNWITP